MIKAVLDTNILISSLFWKGLPRHIVDLAIAQRFESFTSVEILKELEAVLVEDFSDIPYIKITDILKDILSYSQVVATEKIFIKHLRDLSDTKIISCALSAEADYIVTGDHDLLTLGQIRGIQIVTARTFVEKIKAL